MAIPAYRIRYSKKAKYLQLRLSKLGLEVVVPARVSIAEGLIEQFIQKKKPWIERNCLKYAIEPQVKTLTLPVTIELPAINEVWRVFYFETPVKTLTSNFHSLSKIITLTGNVSNHRLCLQHLKNWLKQMAAVSLSKRLQTLAQATGFTYKKLAIKNNRSRWGSCSHSKNINLDCKLLFLLPEWVDHIILHELCHTKVMNHGEQFWNLLKQLDPSAEMHAKLIKTAARSLPAWLNPERSITTGNCI